MFLFSYFPIEFQKYFDQLDFLKFYSLLLYSISHLYKTHVLQNQIQFQETD